MLLCEYVSFNIAVYPPSHLFVYSWVLLCNLSMYFKGPNNECKAYII